MDGDGIKLAVGLMSGTSMDGIDAALLRTDGGARVEPLTAMSLPYGSEFRTALRGTLGREHAPPDLVHHLTALHGQVVNELLARAGLKARDVDVIGFHGHTVFHEPAKRKTIQIGDGEALAKMLGIDVVYDFRSADVAAGGEGAPFAPLYHAVLAPDDRPLCFLNIGGVANLTWIGAGADPASDDIFDHLLAFDTGPGNALIDDWMHAQKGLDFDQDGRLAAAGRVDQGVLETLLSDEFFAAVPPKSLDRTDFTTGPAKGLSPEDGAATLAMFTVQAIGKAVAFLPETPRRWLVTGGGRKNGYLMDALGQTLGAPVLPTEAEGIDGDVLEAQAFAYLAVRSLAGLPLSGPSTTGVSSPQRGGRLCVAHAA